MKNTRFVAIAILGLFLNAGLAAAQDFSRYREFALGSTVAAVSTLTGAAGTELKGIHQRPAVIEELTWRPRYSPRSATGDTKSVDQMVFEFYDDRLFRVTVDYDRRQTEGLNNTDMVDAISAIYGSPVAPVVTRRPRPSFGGDDTAVPIAAWAGGGNSVKLHKVSSYSAGFRLVITAEPTAALAHTAAAQAVVLDAREAPQREAAREKKEADDRRAAAEESRRANKGTFQP